MLKVNFRTAARASSLSCALSGRFFTMNLNSTRTLTFNSHLPVRTLLFQCSVCAHGGHQECYRRYYMERPMVEVTMTSAPSEEIRGRPGASPLLPGNELEDDNTVAADSVLDASGTVALSQAQKFSGHPCATGCG